MNFRLQSDSSYLRHAHNTSLNHHIMITLSLHLTQDFSIYIIHNQREKRETNNIIMTDIHGPDHDFVPKKNYTKLFPYKFHTQEDKANDI